MMTGRLMTEGREDWRKDRCGLATMGRKSRHEVAIRRRTS
jgi:hypothetical protein